MLFERSVMEVNIQGGSFLRYLDADVVKGLDELGNEE